MKQNLNLPNLYLLNISVANDKTTRSIALYIAGIIDANEAIKRLQFNKINNQVSIHTPAALSYLTLKRKYKK